MARGLICTDTAAAAIADRIADIGDVELVPIVGDRPLDDATLERAEVAFFSADAYPERTMHVIGAMLHAPNLRWLHTFSTGVDHPVFGIFLGKGVRLTTSAGSNARPIARTALMHLLALSRRLPSLIDAQRDHRWSPFTFDELEGARIAVIGMGAIGLEVIGLAQAIGMDVVGVRRSVVGDEPCETVPMSQLAEVFPTVRAVVLAVPLTAETTNLVDAAAIASLPVGAYIVNVARGEVLDQAALADALRRGRLGGAALDVFVDEPLPADSELWDLPNTIVTPHSTGMTNQLPGRTTDRFLDNLRRYTAGEALVNEVTSNS